MVMEYQPRLLTNRKPFLALVAALYVSIFLLSTICLAQDSLLPPPTREPAQIVQDPEKVLVKIVSLQTIPKQIQLTKADSSVFFVNSTKNSLLTLIIKYGSRNAHCASGNMKWFKSEGILRSNEPIAPKDFAVMCFADSGVYDVYIFGLKTDGSAAYTRVIVP